MEMKPSNQIELSVGMQQQQLPCPSQALLFDLACDTHLHHCSHDEVNVYLCLTCGSPVFRDDDEQENMDADDDDHDDCDQFRACRHAGSISLKSHALPSSMGFSFLTGGNATMSAA